MILLSVLSFNGEPATGPSASFDELGGTIGRADNNQLVLPDPDRAVSRVHARVVFRAGKYGVVDCGSNPISVNGVPLGAGREQTLSVGDKILVGGYLMQVGAAGTATATADPFADLFGDAAGGMVAGQSPVMAPTPAPALRSPVPPPAAPAPAPALRPGHIPDDWNPFAPDAAPPASPTAPQQGFGFDGLPGSPAVDSLDDLFGLSGGSPSADPLGGAPGGLPGMKPNTAAHADPLQSLGRAVRTDPASAADHGSELNTPMARPAARSPQTQTAPASPALPTGAVFSWDAPAKTPAPVPADPLLTADWSAPAPVAAVVPAASTPTPAAPAASPPGSAPELLQALLTGLAVPGLRLDALTPELMHLVGELLRESTRGAVELLSARAALKREMRAEVTMIVAKQNNPLKFSPSADVALQHLLSPTMAGFMPATPAVRDAFNDLRAHQLGVMAGMKAALDGVLQRFDPAQLEAKLTRKADITSLIPAMRKARLWELFQELFSQLSSEAQDDFDELFGKAFLRAYEAQMDRLHDEAQR
jgi:FHA domain-containing protein